MACRSHHLGLVDSDHLIDPYLHFVVLKKPVFHLQRQQQMSPILRVMYRCYCKRNVSHPWRMVHGYSWHPWRYSALCAIWCPLVCSGNEAATAYEALAALSSVRKMVTRPALRGVSMPCDENQIKYEFMVGWDVQHQTWFVQGA